MKVLYLHRTNVEELPNKVVGAELHTSKPFWKEKKFEVLCWTLLRSLTFSVFHFHPVIVLPFCRTVGWTNYCLHTIVMVWNAAQVLRMIIRVFLASQRVNFSLSRRRADLGLAQEEGRQRILFCRKLGQQVFIIVLDNPMWFAFRNELGWHCVWLISSSQKAGLKHRSIRYGFP